MPFLEHPPISCFPAVPFLSSHLVAPRMMACGRGSSWQDPRTIEPPILLWVSSHCMLQVLLFDENAISSMECPKNLTDQAKSHFSRSNN